MNDNKLETLIQGVSDQVGGLRTDLQNIFSAKSNVGSSPDAPYSTLVIDLTSARDKERITVVNPAKFIQFWTDGGLDGITVRLGQQSAVGLNLNQMRTIPINVVYNDLYLSNDVRQGRAILVIYFVHKDTPLDLALAGQDISQAELAVRSGSINSFDRRGEVIFQDDFEGNLLWGVQYSGAGVGRGVAISTEQARTGQSSCKMTPGDVIGNTASIYRFAPFHTLDRMGFEFSFTLNSNMQSYTFGAMMIDSANVYYPYIKYTVATGVIAVRTAIATWQTIATISLPYADPNLFHTIKLVVELSTKKYIRAVFDHNLIAISGGKPIYGAVAASTPGIEVDVTVTTAVASNQSAFIDDIIVTQNEP